MIGKAKDGRNIVIDQGKRVAYCVHALFHGWLTPEDIEQIPEETKGLDKVIVKFSSCPEADEWLLNEKGFLSILDGRPGFPALLGSGRAAAEYKTNAAEIQTWRSPYLALSVVKGRLLSDYYVLGWDDWEGPSRQQLAQLGELILPGLAERLAEAHDLGIAHRDVKPDNAIFDPVSRTVSLIDFDRANRLDGPASNLAGTFSFTPPEVYSGGQRSEDRRIDTYGFGATAFVLLTAEPGISYAGSFDPFAMSPIEAAFMGRQMIREDYIQGLQEQAGRDAGELLKRLNMPYPLKNTTLGRYLASLIHPSIDQRPLDMREIAGEIRKAAGELLPHELNLD